MTKKTLTTGQMQERYTTRLFLQLLRSQCQIFPLLKIELSVAYTALQNHRFFHIHTRQRADQAAISCLYDNCSSSLLFLCFRPSLGSSPCGAAERDIRASRNLCSISFPFCPIYPGCRLVPEYSSNNNLQIFCWALWKSSSECLCRHNRRYLGATRSSYSNGRSRTNSVPWSLLWVSGATTNEFHKESPLLIYAILDLLSAASQFRQKAGAGRNGSFSLLLLPLVSLQLA